MSVRAGTYSIAALDPATGELGVAVQSHWFSVGSIVTWGRPGVGVVATQSIAEPAYGPRLLDRLERGETAAAALSRALSADPQARFRQLAVLGPGGGAAHTGDGCIEYAGHIEGKGFSAQANMMASAGVWPAMADAYRQARGPLERRLLAALEAAETAGGDVRGSQSAAILVVPASGERWESKLELRVEDSADPLGELARLLDLGDAYALADAADELACKGDHEEAARLYRAAAEAAPGSVELGFWAGLGIAAGGDVSSGADRVAAAIAVHGGWRDLLARLEPEIAPAAGAVRAALGIPPP